MLTYAVSLEKGGTGKSSIAVNLTVAFQQRGLRTLLIDLDAQGRMLRDGSASRRARCDLRTAFWALFAAGPWKRAR
jgi:chromosome partitioning protein